MMSHDMLYKNITRLRSQGFSDNAILGRLVLAGWSEEKVAAALNPARLTTPAAMVRGTQRPSVFLHSRQRGTRFLPASRRTHRPTGRLYSTLVIGLVLFAVSGAVTAYFFHEPDFAYSNATSEEQSTDATPLPTVRGAWTALFDEAFYTDIIEQFKKTQSSFIAVNLSALSLEVYTDGEVVLVSPILSRGASGSWCETPAGIYNVSELEESRFSTLEEAYLPWSVAFGGNAFFHGWPHDKAGERVEGESPGGCVVLSDDDAKAVYAAAFVGMPVVVYDAPIKEEEFTYRPKGPNITGRAFFSGDIKNNSVLFGTNEESVVPIASITKLMTALVVAEFFDLDESVRVSEEALVETAIPRLVPGQEIGVYNLLTLMLTESSNEAAEAFAAVLGRDRFIELMNEKAQALGLDHTSFHDPSGLSERNLSSARDLFVLLQYLYENRRFILHITNGSPGSGGYEASAAADFYNFNITKGIPYSFVGGKIGNTDEAKRTFAGIFMLPIGEEGARPIGIVLLGSEDIRADITSALDYLVRLY